MTYRQDDASEAATGWHSEITPEMIVIGDMLRDALRADDPDQNSIGYGEVSDRLMVDGYFLLPSVALKFLRSCEKRGFVTLEPMARKQQKNL